MMEKVSDFLNRASEIALTVVLAAMAIAVFLQVLFRYALHLPLFWTEEFARYCLVWASLLGAAVALKRGEHIAVTIFLENLPKGLAQILIVVARISVALILMVIIWGGVKLVIITSVQVSPALRIPMAVPYLALPLGSAIMLVHVITSILRMPQQTTQEDQYKP
jgi:TRAP-type C4-dicarboxylate transport system permease small subunit